MIPYNSQRNMQRYNPQPLAEEIPESQVRALFSQVALHRDGIHDMGRMYDIVRRVLGPDEERKRVVELVGWLGVNWERVRELLQKGVEQLMRKMRRWWMERARLRWRLRSFWEWLSRLVL